MYYLAVDIGASSGRHILGSLQDGKIVLEEVYRFKNGNVMRDGHLCWELDRLFAEIKNGMRKCAEIGKNPTSMGIDCFGVDFVLLDKENNIIGDTVAYRDSRTNGMQEAVFKKISDARLYEITGVQSQIFNTIYQLNSLPKEDFERADRFLQIAEYFNFLLTGEKKNEFTNATTTQLINTNTNDFDGEILDALCIPRRLFRKPCMPGTEVGKLLPDIMEETGLDCTVVLPATHDTASAIMAVPTTDDCLYISSGTWSLMGTLLPRSLNAPISRRLHFTNEGAYDGGARYLKNIMGLWIIQSIKRNLNDAYTFAQLCDMAQASDYAGRIDVNDNCFLAPENMIDAIKTYLAAHDAPAPESLGDILHCVYHSLAQSYRETTKEIEDTIGKKYKAIYIIGGGCQDVYLNQLTAEYTGKPVYAGPVEATALGNILMQMLRLKDFANIKLAKRAIQESFDIQKIEQ